MKKFKAILFLVIACLALCACREASGTKGPTGTPAQTTEKIYYDYTDEGFTLTKQYADKKGNVVKEVVCTVDKTLGILWPYATVDVTASVGGKFSATAVYTQNPMHGAPDKTVHIAPAANELYTHEVKDAGGNVLLYLKESTDTGAGETIEYFTAAGRLIRTESTKFGENGERKSFTAKDGTGKKLCSRTYNKNGNIVTAEFYGEETTLRVKAEYYGNGIIRTCESETVSNQTNYVSEPETLKFTPAGYLKVYNTKTSEHDESGNVTSVRSSLLSYTFDESGRVVKCEDRSNLAVLVTTEYTYDESGRILSVKTKNPKVALSANIYTYAEDGTYTVEVQAKNFAKTQMRYYNAAGSITRLESYTRTQLNSHQTYEYDVLGRLTRSEYYVGKSLYGTEEYAYNAHGDLTLEKKTGTLGSVNKTYEYFEDGRLKSYSSFSASNKKTESVEYFEDGCYCHTLYGSDGYVAKTYNKSEMLVKETVHARGVTTERVFEYHSNGKESLVTVRVNGVLRESAEYNWNGKPLLLVSVGEDSTTARTVYEYYANGNMRSMAAYTAEKLTAGAKYLENGTVDELTVTDADGSTVTSKYVRESGVPVRIDTYRNGAPAGYTELEYFTYTDDEKNNPKSVRTYDESGALVLLMVYEKITVQINPGYAYVLTKEEVYESGVLTAYCYMEYSAKNGVLERKKEMLGSIRTESVYDTNTSGAEGDMIEQKTFVGDVLTTVYFRYENTSPPRYAEDFYGENGKPAYRYVYNAHSEELTVDNTYVYEYYESGELFREALYDNWGGKNELEKITEYDKAGNTACTEEYSYYSTGEVGEKTICYYGENGLLLRRLNYRRIFSDLLLDSEELFEYGENGEKTKATTVDYGTDGEVDSTLTLEFDEEGRTVREFTESASGKTSETLWEYSESGDLLNYAVYEGGELKMQNLTVLDESGKVVRTYYFSYGTSKETLISYNSHGLESERLYYENEVLTARTVYEYHKNGQVSLEIKYDGAGNETYRAYYNEQGEKIPLN